MDKKRFYNFLLVIYEDDEKFDKQHFNLVQEKDAIWIRHDSDVYESDVIDDDVVIHEAGEVKKPHYHFLLKLKNACTISALAKRIEVPENMIEPVKKSFNGSLKYLIHFGSDNKFQYSPDDVESNSESLKRRFLDLVSTETPEVDKVICLQQFIEEYPDYIKVHVIGKYAQKINVWDAFRRNYSYIKDLINEHNGQISGERYNYKYTNKDYYNSE